MVASPLSSDICHSRERPLGKLRFVEGLLSMWPVLASRIVCIRELRKYGRDDVGVHTESAQSYRAEKSPRASTVVISSSGNVAVYEGGGFGSRDD
jgi:hypothetical protein